MKWIKLAMTLDYANLSLDEMTLPAIAFAAAEFFAVKPGAGKAALIVDLHRDIEARFKQEPTNIAGYQAALDALKEADHKGVLEEVCLVAV